MIHYIYLHPDAEIKIEHFLTLMETLALNEESRRRQRVLTLNDLSAMAGQPGFTMVIAFDPEDENRIVGMASIGILDFPSGKKGFVEDVVVLTDEKYRGRGIGKGLTLELVAIAKREGVKKIELTCAPERVMANQMYEKLGFKKIPTNFRRLYLNR